MLQKATFAAGCFWGVEAAFRKFLDKGVVETLVGYTGGTTHNPSYFDVAYKKTGHAEVVQVTYDPDQISYQRLLDIFFQVHDPTQYNRQGNDVGDEYRSAVFYHTDEQRQLAEQAIVDMQPNYKKPIVTMVVPADEFYPAEEEHQRYLEKHPGGYCHVDLDAVN
jgi:peptide-methionine (S)-S-oxide reductase